MSDTRHIRNLDHGAVLVLKDQVDYQSGQIVSRTLGQNRAVSLTLFAFDRGEAIGTHASHGDAMIQALDGVGQITLGETVYELKAGETIVLPAGIPHAVHAQERFKMLLTVVFPKA